MCVCVCVCLCVCVCVCMCVSVGVGYPRNTVIKKWSCEVSELRVLMTALWKLT